MAYFLGMTGEELAALLASIPGKLDKTDVANTLAETGEGKALDARQGKELNERITSEVTTLNGAIAAETAARETAVGNLSAAQRIEMAAAMERQRAQAEAGRTVLPDETVSTHSRISTLAATAREGQMDVRVGGHTAKNEVVNGNFANGTTGWTMLYGTGVVANNILTLVGNNYSTLVRCRHEVGFKMKSGERLYLHVRIRALEGVAPNNLQAMIRDGASGKYYTASTPLFGTSWTKVSTIIEATEDMVNNTNVVVGAVYAENATPAEKIQVAEVYIVRMGTDSSHPDYNKTLAEMEAKYPHYFDGFASVVAGSVKTTGKNLLDPKAFEEFLDLYDTAQYPYSVGVEPDGSEYFRFLNSLYRYKRFMYGRFKPNTQYTLKAAMKTEEGGKTLYLGFEYVDGSFTRISTVSTTYEQQILVSDANKTISHIFILFGTTAYARIKKDGFQLEESSTATPYEPYTAITRPLPATVLRSVPNGVRDTVDGMRLVQNCKEYELTESDITAYRTNYTNLDYVQVQKPLDSFVCGTTDVNIGATFIPGFPNKGFEGNVDNAEHIGYSFHSAGGSIIYLGVPKGTYTGLAAAKAALAGTKIVYQLKEPIITELLPEVLKSSPNGSVQYLNQRREIGVYSDKAEVSFTSAPIKSVLRIYKVSADGSRTRVSLDGLMVAADRLSFTHTGLSEGDLIVWEYEFDSALSTTSLLEYGYKND